MAIKYKLQQQFGQFLEEADTKLLKYLHARAEKEGFQSDLASALKFKKDA